MPKRLNLMKNKLRSKSRRFLLVRSTRPQKSHGRISWLSHSSTKRKSSLSVSIPSVKTENLLMSKRDLPSKLLKTLKMLGRNSKMIRLLQIEIREISSAPLTRNGSLKTLIRSPMKSKSS